MHSADLYSQRAGSPVPFWTVRHTGILVLLGVVLSAEVARPAEAGREQLVVDAAVMPGGRGPPEMDTEPPDLGWSTPVLVTLPPLTPRERASTREPSGRPVRVGIPRAIPAESQGNLRSRLHWISIGDGLVVGELRVRSAGAIRLRIGMRVAMPPGGQLLFYGRQGSPRFETITRADIAASEREGELLWSPVVDGDTVVVRILLGSLEAVPSVRFELLRVSHILAGLGELLNDRRTECPNHLDVQCRIEDFTENLYDAVARLLYTEADGSSYACSGTLVNDRDDSTHVPFLMTAHHCISTSSAAATLEATWFFRNRTCGGDDADQYRTTVGGADLLATSADQDSTLLRLRNPGPSGVTLSGWSAQEDDQRPGATVVGLHHADGGPMKYAAGVVAGHTDVELQDDEGEGQFLISDAIIVDWHEGTTENGSSGSGLFKGSRLVGVLAGGNGCYEPSVFGPFHGFFPRVRRWLVDGNVPDLVVESPVVSEQALSPGARFELSASVRNIGTANAQNTALRYYRSFDPSVSALDIEEGVAPIRGLAPGESQREPLELEAPLSAGKYYYGACADAVSEESDTFNNCSAGVHVTVGLAKPDLAIDSLMASAARVSPGQHFDLTASVRNRGDGISSRGRFLFVRSLDAEITNGDTVVAATKFGRLLPSESAQAQVAVSAPLTLGPYYYGACVASSSGDSDESNNCSMGRRVVIGDSDGYADLVVDPPSLSGDRLRPGQSAQLTAVVGNVGDGWSSPTMLRIYLSGNYIISARDSEVQTVHIEPLDASTSAVKTVEVVAPKSEGTYYYGACVDSVPEEEEGPGNNCSQGTQVTVTSDVGGAPDLVVDRPMADRDRVRAGETVGLIVAIRNQGDADAEGTILRYYLSEDAVVSSLDREVGKDRVNALAASATDKEWFALAAPDEIGTVYVGGCVDAVAGETSRSNNCSVGFPLTVVGEAGRATDGSQRGRTLHTAAGAMTRAEASL